MVRTRASREPSPEVAAILAGLDVPAFQRRMRGSAAPLYRDLAWRRTRDPYAIWLSEVMLQQTQVARVAVRWDEWMRAFPTLGSLAAAPDADVLQAWQGMGYNRRALALAACARTIVTDHGGAFPTDARELESLPGIGPSTAAGIRAFAFDLAGVYLETNVRAVYIHEFFPDATGVPDRDLADLVRATCPADGCDVRGWYLGLLDIGAELKKTMPNPSRRAKAYTRQSRFEGSRRQKRAAIVRILLAARGRGTGLTTDEVALELAGQEASCGRPAPEGDLVASILADLERESFCRHEDGLWSIR